MGSFDDRVIAAMRVRAAGIAFFFDVVHIAVSGQLAVASDDAAAVESCEPQEPNEATHANVLREPTVQIAYRQAPEFVTDTFVLLYRRAGDFLAISARDLAS